MESSVTTGNTTEMVFLAPFGTRQLGAKSVHGLFKKKERHSLDTL